MQGASDEMPAGYAWLLRAAGAYLDQMHAWQVTVIESEGGFELRYRPGPVGDMWAVCLRFDALLRRRVDLVHRRSIGLSLRRRSTESRGYQDTLRALGTQFDQVEARTILLDESDDGLLVSYQYFSPGSNYLPRKHMAIVNAAGVRKLVTEARAQRRGYVSGPPAFGS